MTEPLKHCPFCGNTAELEQEEQEYPTGGEWYRVICSDCGGNSGWYMWPEAAIANWNSRV